ncbi:MULTISPECIES: GNAT family N-acetyltransferase [Sphingomonas]|uniref:GNAT family N-acetyltransferase n=1 Tax=Sphingomonas TaxID=13687 RepID=UPI00083626BA|nr:GNAT family N-acetyltransferase [Sphingomonas sp. CCH10-B3]
MTQAIAFSIATARDVPALHALVESAYRGDSARGGWTHEADLLGGQRTDQAALAEAIASPDQLILLARDAAAIRGCVELTRVGAGRAYLGLLSVAPEWQGRALGKALIDAAEAEAQTRFGATHIEMTVIRQRAALIAYYQRRGYILTGETRPFPYGDERFGRPRVDDLSFVVLEKPLRSPAA